MILTSGSGAVGFGVDGNSTGDFGGGATPYKIPSGSHYPRSGTAVELWANWYDTAAPKSAAVNINGTCSAMTRQRGTDTNGAWMFNATGLTGCARYYFTFKDSTGATIDYPTTGSFGIGDATCADYATTRPAACGVVPTDSGVPDTAVAPDTFIGDSLVTTDTLIAKDTSVVPDTTVSDAATDPDAARPDTEPLEDGMVAPPIEEDSALNARPSDASDNTAPSVDAPAGFEGSCGCHTPRGSQTTPWALALVLLALRRRR